MVDVSNSAYSTTDASNTTASPNGWPNGTFPNQVEPIGRQSMGAIKRWWERSGPALPTTGSANAYVYTPSNVTYPAAYVQGDIYCAVANFANTGAATLNVNGLGAKNIFAQTTAGPAALVGGEIQSGQVFAVGYDGTQFQLISPSSPIYGTYTPVITLAGGAGNTVPVYTTNSGHYNRVGNRVFIDILFTGDGGAEGAGSGQFTVTLPVSYSGSVLGGYYPLGYFQNSTSYYLVYGQLTGGNLIALIYKDTVSTFTTMTGDNQNNTAREVRLSLSYQI